MTKRKFGKKNIVKLDPFAYNIGLIGESGAGKTTVMKEMCEILGGEESYLIANMGMESGVDAIADAMYEDFPDFQTLNEFVEDIEDNREDYKELRVVVFDTLDELFRITEQEVIRLHNKLNPDKRVTSISASWGGYGRGEDKAIELILGIFNRLKSIGINYWVVGHTKRKSVSDLVTAEEYETLTSNMMAKYFNSVKTKLHILGVASVDRDIEKVKVKQKMGNDKVVGKVKSESRIITFRDDNFNIDSKSRFAEIVPEITLDADEFIKAIKDAIDAENNKHKNKKKSEEYNKEVQEKQDNHKAENSINEKENAVHVEYIKENIMTSKNKDKAVNLLKELEAKTIDDCLDKPTVKVKEIVEVIKEGLK